MNKRIVFLGTPGFAAHQLKALLEANLNIVGVITAPDKKKGRGQKLSATPVKELALEHNIPVLQPENLKDEAFVEELRTLKADLQVVVAFRMLPEAVWNMPELGTVNLHASYLPNYRGAAPINWCIINGETETGISTFLLKHEIDTGNVIDRTKVAIEEEDNAGTLHDKLMNEGGSLLVKSVNQVLEGTAEYIPQEKLAENTTSKHAPKIFKPDCALNWNESAEVLHNKVRGLSPYPAAYTLLKLKDKEEPISVKIFASSITTENNLKVGEYTSDNKSLIQVGTSTHNVSISEVQFPGKKRLNIKQFLAGFEVNSIEKFT